MRQGIGIVISRQLLPDPGVGIDSVRIDMNGVLTEEKRDIAFAVVHEFVVSTTMIPGQHPAGHRGAVFVVMHIVQQYSRTILAKRNQIYTRTGEWKMEGVLATNRGCQYAQKAEKISLHAAKIRRRGRYLWPR